MANKTKRPTVEEIQIARQLAWRGFEAEVPPDASPTDYRNAAERLDRFDYVFDYAAACLKAEEEGERVPKDAGGVGTPVWREETDAWRAYIGSACRNRHVLAVTYPGLWFRYTNDGGDKEVEGGGEDTLAANIRAATASWNAAHPDLPPVVVPEQFRESEEGPEVEAAEDAGDDGWIAWEGGECPVPVDALVEVVMRNGALHEDEADNLAWWHYDSDEDIVEYRVVVDEDGGEDADEQPPTDPEARVGAMSNEEVEAGLTGRGVGAWLLTDTTYGRHDRAWTGGPWAAIDINGACYANDPSRRMLSGPQGTTTTPEGRAECNRRLLVHLLREEQKGG